LTFAIYALQDLKDIKLKLNPLAAESGGRGSPWLQREGVLNVIPQKGGFVADQALELIQNLIVRRKRNVVFLTFTTPGIPGAPQFLHSAQNLKKTDVGFSSES